MGIWAEPIDTPIWADDLIYESAQNHTWAAGHVYDELKTYWQAHYAQMAEYVPNK